MIAVGGEGSWRIFSRVGGGSCRLGLELSTVVDFRARHPAVSESRLGCRSCLRSAAVPAGTQSASEPLCLCKRLSVTASVPGIPAPRVSET